MYFEKEKSSNAVKIKIIFCWDFFPPKTLKEILKMSIGYFSWESQNICLGFLFFGKFYSSIQSLGTDNNNNNL